MTLTLRRRILVAKKVGLRGTVGLERRPFVVEILGKELHWTFEAVGHLSSQRILDDDLRRRRPLVAVKDQHAGSGAVFGPHTGRLHARRNGGPDQDSGFESEDDGGGRRAQRCAPCIGANHGQAEAGHSFALHRIIPSSQRTRSLRQNALLVNYSRVQSLRCRQKKTGALLEQDGVSGRRAHQPREGRGQTRQESVIRSMVAPPSAVLYAWNLQLHRLIRRGQPDATGVGFDTTIYGR